jgi:hypothetical protein
MVQIDKKKCFSEVCLVQLTNKNFKYSNYFIRKDSWHPSMALVPVGSWG